jgi:hypothetical protein
MTVTRAWLLTGLALFLALLVLSDRPPPSPSELAKRAETNASMAAQRAENQAAIEEAAHDIACWWRGGPEVGDRVWAQGWSLSEGRDLERGWGAVVWVGEVPGGYAAHVRLDSGPTILAFSDGGIAFPGEDPRNACR